MKKICLHTLAIAAFLLLFCVKASAQYHLEGDDPAGVVWKQLKSEHFKVIYPEETDSLARRYLFLFERNRELTLKGLKIESPTMPIVIHPYNVNSNGVTYWAPRTVGIYSTPPFEYLTPQNWETMLALHEGRHVGQMSHYMKGFYKFLYILAGEQTTGILNTSTTFNEGDAVMHETDFTSGGRGRSVDFLRAYRTAFVSDAKVPHEQWRFGSFDRYVPNKYAFGYVILSSVRYNRGDYFIPGDFFRQYARDWWRIFSGTSHSLSTVSDGLTVRTNWALAETRLTDYWKAEDEMRRPFSPMKDLVRKRGKKYTEYFEVIPRGDGSVVMLKEGMDYARKLVVADSLGNQKELTVFPANTSSLTKDSGDVLLFSEVVPDPRWTLRSFSILREYDISTGRFRNVTKNTRLFNPTFSEDESSIFAAEYKVGGGSSVVEVDRATGAVKGSTDAPLHGQISEMVRIGGKLYASVITEEGIGIYVLSSGEWENLTKPGNTYIRHLRKYGEEEISFASDLNGIENVYLFNVRTRSLDLLTSSRFGVKAPTIDAETDILYCSDYDTSGFRPVSVPMDSLRRKPMDFSQHEEYFIADRLSEQAARNVKIPSAEEDSLLYSGIRAMESRPYRKAGNLFHIHSWFPCYPRMDRIKHLDLSDILSLVDPGITLISQNLLGTAVTQAGYSYSIRDKLHAGHINFNYSGWYPVIEMQADVNDHVRTRVSTDGSRYRLDTLSKPSFDFYTRIYVPLDFSRSGWNMGLVPSLQCNFFNDVYEYQGKSHFKHDITASLSFYRMMNQPTARLTPLWGVGVTASLRGAMGPASALPETMAYVNIYGYLPGITSDQGIKLSFSRQVQNSKFYYGGFSNLASVPRGYDKNRILTDYMKVTFDYAIPIYAIEGMRGWLGYVKRMEFIPFVDAALDRPVIVASDRIIQTSGYEKMLSYGFDWLLDGNLFRMGMKLSVGFRYAHTVNGINYLGVLFNSKL